MGWCLVLQRAFCKVEGRVKGSFLMIMVTSLSSLGVKARGRPEGLMGVIDPVSLWCFKIRTTVLRFTSAAEAIPAKVILVLWRRTTISRFLTLSVMRAMGEIEGNNFTKKFPTQSKWKRKEGGKVEVKDFLKKTTLPSFFLPFHLLHKIKCALCVWLHGLTTEEDRSLG